MQLLIHVFDASCEASDPFTGGLIYGGDYQCCQVRKQKHFEYAL